MASQVLKGRYELVREIGSGAMGTVHEGWDRELERRVAVKRLPSGTHAEDVRARFIREAKLMARVHHPHVAAVFDCGISEEGDPFIVMELLSGETLRTRIEAQKTLAVGDALRFAIDMAKGLGAIHAAGLIHRDLKPANTFVTRVEDRDVLKVLDLGLARITNEQTLSDPGAVVGTALYIAPEQIRGGEIDHRADLYALGATVFEMLEGKPPFSRPSAIETIHAQLYDPPPAMKRAIPRALVEVIEKSLAKKPADRFDSARSMELALARFLDAPVAGPLPVSSAEPPASSGDAPELELDLPPPVVEPEPIEELRPPIPLEVDDVPAHPATAFQPSPLFAPSYRMVPPPTVPGAHRSLARREPSAIVGVFAVLPAAVHQRLALGGTILAIVGFALTGSWLLFLLLALIGAFGVVGYFVRRKVDGYED